MSQKQFGFCTGQSTVDAIQTVVDMARKARNKTRRLKKKGFCALFSIDIRNAFNSAR